MRHLQKAVLELILTMLLAPLLMLVVLSLAATAARGTSAPAPQLDQVRG